MPRLRPPPNARRQSNFSSPAKTTQIPLNDDTAEKAKRHKKRSILQDMQMNKIAAAAVTPGRRVTIGGDDRGESPVNTPLRGGVAGDGPLDAVTPMRKVPILANFEEWMKLATDNKINATNSWNFALIDYFYDMSLLKEGDGINFQKASCTLDGCVKIYTNRIDSVATETGKLLSGLADSSSKRKGRGEDGGDGEGSDAEGDEDEEGPKKSKRKAQRSSEVTLAKDFSSLAIKKLELEFSVDPLFKKASADFDEGGAKGLLLNNLSIDSNGKIVFDSSDDKKSPEELRAELAADDDGTPHPDPQPQKDPEQEGDEDVDIDIAVLAARFFPDLARLDSMDVCPSLKAFDLGDPAGSLDIPFLKALEDRGEELESSAPSEAGDAFGGGNDMAFGSDDGFGVGGGGDMTLGFGEGGEVWANETIADAAERFMSPAKRPLLGMGGAAGEEKFGETGGGDYNVGFGGNGHEDVLSYFDEALRKNWAGPEHWRIRKIKDNSKPVAAPVRARKEKETFEIDFMSPAADIPEEILLPPRGRATIDLPKKDWKTKTRHLLPDDKHFNSRQLLTLFLKPKASIQSSKRRRLTIGHTGGNRSFAQEAAAGEDMDEEFWAKEGMAMDIQASSTPDPKVAGNYDANFFQDDGLDMRIGMRDDDDDDDFADAREAFSPGPDGKGVAQVPMGTQDPGGTQFPPSTFGGMEFGSQLVTSNRRVRPEYVQYARVAKKVDVRKLKENLWTGLAFEAAATATATAEKAPREEGAMDVELPPTTRKFTAIMNDLQSVYPQKAMSDISTSYCFICLLHLANEKGLAIEGSETLTELSVTVDTTAEGPDEF